MFHDARAKCDALRKRLADVESELHVLETSPPRTGKRRGPRRPVARDRHDAAERTCGRWLGAAERNSRRNQDVDRGLFGALPGHAQNGTQPLPNMLVPAATGPRLHRQLRRDCNAIQGGAWGTGNLTTESLDFIDFGKLKKQHLFVEGRELIASNAGIQRLHRRPGAYS